MAPRILPVHYAGRGMPLFLLALKTGLLTLLTLGFYRFWARTRLRRYFWSAIRPGHAPLEYVGDPIEKLMGFLVAVVIMAFYIGVVNLLLMYASFALFQGNVAAYVLSFIGLIPLYFFAAYRARRYVFARTRWRGIRFGMVSGAWGYAWRAMVHWGLAITLLGALYPMTTLWLEKYLVNRTYYGDQQFHQGGGRFMLFGAMKHVYYALGLSAVAGGMTALSENPLWALFAIVTGPWFFYGLAYWRAESFKRMTEATTLGDIRFRTRPRPGRIIGIYLLGWLILNVVLYGALMVLFVLMAVVLGSAIGVDIDFEKIENIETMGTALTPVVVAIYFMLIVFIGAVSKALFTLPLARHFAEVTEVLDPNAIAAITQRERDEFAEAEGFADALDVGAAI